MNFDHLSYFGDEAVKRFATLTRNIQAKSNSFYDAYLGLQETVVKAALIKGDYPAPVDRNSGYLLHGAEVKQFLVQAYGINSTLIERLHDHTLKANKHKHEKEKRMDINSILAFMEPFYVFSRFCAGMNAVGINAFDPLYFVSIFGQLETENRQLRHEVETLMQQAESMAAQHKLTAEELAACKGLVLALDGEKSDLEAENAQIKQVITILQSMIIKRVEALERKVEELDVKIAGILNQFRAVPPRQINASSPIPKREPTKEEEELVKDFFKNAKLYFADEPNGPVNICEGRMMRRGIVCGIAGLVTFVIALFLPSSYKAFAIAGATMILYGIFMFIIGFKVAGYEMQDPSEFWIMARGEAVFNGKIVISRFYSSRWKWMTTLLFIISLVGVIEMLFAVSPLVQQNQPVTAASFAVLQAVVAIVVLIFCIAVTGKSYEFRYVIFQYKDDVIRFDRQTGQWNARDKKLKGYRL